MATPLYDTGGEKCWVECARGTAAARARRSLRRRRGLGDTGAVTVLGPLDHARLLASAATLALAATLLSGCPHNFITQPITREGGQWRATLRALHDGPNVIRPTGWTAYYAVHGRRLLHATFEVTNLAPDPRPFDYAECVMDNDRIGVSPGLVTTRNGLWMAIDHVESYGTAETSTRMLTYSYPEFRFPTRIECPGMQFDIPQPGDAATATGAAPASSRPVVAPTPAPPPVETTPAPWASDPPGSGS